MDEKPASAREAVAETPRQRVPYSKHGGSAGDRKTYQAWCDMKQRCYNPRNHAYKWYGARGIRVCEKWLTFKGFFKDMGSKPSGLQLERIDNNGNYESSNCKWATLLEQKNNTRTNRHIEIEGITKTAAQWAAAFKIDKDTFLSRLKRGLSPKEALTKPLDCWGKNRDRD